MLPLSVVAPPVRRSPLPSTSEPIERIKALAEFTTGRAGREGWYYQQKSPFQSTSMRKRLWVIRFLNNMGSGIGEQERQNILTRSVG